MFPKKKPKEQKCPHEDYSVKSLPRLNKHVATCLSCGEKTIPHNTRTEAREALHGN